MSQKAKPPVFFLVSVLGLLGLVGVVTLVAWAKPHYEKQLWWFAHATSESSWIKYCGQSKAFMIGGRAAWYEEQVLSPERCEQGDAIVTQPVRELEKECPIIDGYEATGCDHNGRFMKVAWQITQQQKTAPE